MKYDIKETTFFRHPQSNSESYSCNIENQAVTMSLHFLKNYIDWNLLLQNSDLTKKIAEASLDNLSLQLLEEMSPFINFKEMSNDPKTPEILLHLHSHRLDFRKLLLSGRTLSIDFIRDHLSTLNKCWD